MYLEIADRRRLVFATIITIVALPTLWLTSRDEASDGTLNPVAAAVNGGSPVFMVGPTAPPVPEPEVATPAPVADQVTGRATFRRWDSATVAQLRNYPCHTTVAPVGARVTVTNVNNGRSVPCVNTGAETAATNAIIVLHTEALLSIGDLADAPLPVRVTW